MTTSGDTESDAWPAPHYGPIGFAAFVEGRMLARQDIYLRGYLAADVDALAGAVNNPATSLAGPGLYLICPVRALRIGGIAVDRHQPIYVGMSSDIAKRDHFGAVHSGFSTVRRSLGALLKQELSLTAIPRSPGSSPTNYRNYRFDEAGEARLTNWMESELRLARITASERVEERERRLIEELWPVINLTAWKNSYAPEIKALRAACAAEAKAAR